jgi:hypothetical protein
LMVCAIHFPGWTPLIFSRIESIIVFGKYKQICLHCAFDLVLFLPLLRTHTLIRSFLRTTYFFFAGLVSFDFWGNVGNGTLINSVAAARWADYRWFNPRSSASQDLYRMIIDHRLDESTKSSIKYSKGGLKIQQSRRLWTTNFGMRV